MLFKLDNLNSVTASRLPESCINCGWWQGYNSGWPNEQAVASWQSMAEKQFGRWGKIAIGDDKLLGVVQYGPASLFDRSLSSGPVRKDSILLTCGLVCDQELASVSKSLLLAVIAELLHEKHKYLEAFCRLSPAKSDNGHMFDPDFLKGFGFYPVKSSSGIQLMRLELGGIQPVKPAFQKSRRSLLQRIKRSSPTPAPASLCTTIHHQPQEAKITAVA